MPTGQVWYLSASGGYFANPKLSMNLRTVGQPRTRFRQFTETKESFGKSMGDVLDFNKVMNVQTAGGKLTEGVPIPKTQITINRGQCTAYEYGNAIPWTSKFETLSQFDTNDPIQNALVNDNTKTIDRVVKTEFAKSRVKYVPTGTVGAPTATWEISTTTNAAGEYVATATATRDFALWDLKNIVDALKKGVFGSYAATPVATYDGKDYVAISGVDGARAIKDDPDFEEVVKFGDPDRFWNGEVGRIYSTRLVEETNILSTLGASGYKGEMFIFGAETVMEITVVNDEIRRSIPGDFGREKAMAWYSLLGFTPIWPGSGIVSGSEPMATIVHVTSA
jgi:N4-gp56 family major capsid protein